MSQAFTGKRSDKPMAKVQGLGFRLSHWRWQGSGSIQSKFNHNSLEAALGFTFSLWAMAVDLSPALTPILGDPEQRFRMQDSLLSFIVSF